jgi:hypothetical protein
VAKTGRPPRGFELRFWEKVVKQPSGCWIFTSKKGSSHKNRHKSYGHLSRSKDNWTNEYQGHRISWVLVHGPVPEGSDVLHRCDTRRCVNPEHLFLGTHEDNMKDMVSKGRYLTGSNNPVSKLTEEQVLEIRRLYKTGGWSQPKLAVRYGVHQTTIGFIVRRVRWSHI